MFLVTQEAGESKYIHVECSVPKSHKYPSNAVLLYWWQDLGSGPFIVGDFPAWLVHQTGPVMKCARLVSKMSMQGLSPSGMAASSPWTRSASYSQWLLWDISAFMPWLWALCHPCPLMQSSASFLSSQGHFFSLKEKSRISLGFNIRTCEGNALLAFHWAVSMLLHYFHCAFLP